MPMTNFSFLEVIIRSLTESSLFPMTDLQYRIGIKCPPSPEQKPYPGCQLCRVVLSPKPDHRQMKREDGEFPPLDAASVSPWTQNVAMESTLWSRKPLPPAAKISFAQEVASVIYYVLQRSRKCIAFESSWGRKEMAKWWPRQKHTEEEDISFHKCCRLWL